MTTAMSVVVVVLLVLMVVMVVAVVIMVMVMRHCGVHGRGDDCYLIKEQWEDRHNGRDKRHNLPLVSY